MLKREPHRIGRELNEKRRGHASFALFLSKRGWSYDRIARELSCSKSTVQAMLVYAREHEDE